MTTTDFFEIFHKYFINDFLAVCSLGRTAEECYKILPMNQILFLDCLGSVTDISIGIALGCSNDKVFAFDTDGSFLFNISSIHSLSELQYQLKNLTIFIFDNEILESGGGKSSRLCSLDWNSMFRAWNLHLNEIHNKEELIDFLNKSNNFSSLNIILLHIDNCNIPNTCTKDIDGRESKYMFKRYINTKIKKGILKPCRKN